jgi:peptide/nickel transport system substrate-binding protein
MPAFPLTTARRRWPVLALAGVLPLLGMTACTPSASETATPKETITTAWPEDVTSLDPADHKNGQDMAMARNLYQALLSPAYVEQKDGSLKVDGAKVKPMLAESWTTSDSSVTFTLRQGVKFQNSDDTVDADDVKWSLGRIWNTPALGDIQANGLQSQDDIHVVDPKTVRVDFKTTDGKPTPVTPTLLAIFDQPWTGIISRDLVKPHLTAADPTGTEWLRANTAGTGPYQIDSRQVGVTVVLQANPTSWAPQPAYKTVTIQVSSGNVQSLLKNGDINFGEFGMTNQEVNSLQQAGMNVYWATTGNFDMFAITAGPKEAVGPLGDTRVRQAMAYAMPYEQILKNVVFGRGSRDDSIVPPSAPEYTPAWSTYKTDVAKAKDLMHQAGDPAVNVPLHYLGNDPDQTNTAILIQAALKEIGVTTVLTPQTSAGLFDVVNSRSQPATGTDIGPPGLELFNWTAWTDDPKIAIGYWATTGGINNYTLWSSPEVDAINAEYALQATSAARTEAYKKAQTLIAADVPLFPIVSTGTVAVTAKGITGVAFTPTGSSRFWTLHPEGTPSEITKLFA